MTEPTYHVLFLCRANSARSILAEAILNDIGGGRFRAYSAGSEPRGEVHPLARSLLEHLGLPTDALRSKSWDEFAAPDAPHLDFVFTLCGDSMNEACPVWPGHPVTAHWGIDDPAAVEGTELERHEAFRSAFRALEHRIRLFTCLPIPSLERLKLKESLEGIGAADTPRQTS